VAGVLTEDRVALAVSRLVLAAVLLAVATVTSPADDAIELRPPAEVDIAQLVRELQWTASDPRDLSMVWLFPTSLMEALLVQGGDVDPERASSTVSVFDPYLIMGVVRGGFGPDGRPAFESANVVRSSVRLVDDRGRAHTPVLEPDSLAALALSRMQFTLGTQLGDLGGHTVFVLFPGLDPDGRPFFTQERRATLRVELAALGTLPAQRVTWHLPLGALVEDRVCPACRGAFNGAWLFCPWDGRHLVTPEALPPDSGPPLPSDPDPTPGPDRPAPTVTSPAPGQRGPGLDGP